MGPGKTFIIKGPAINGKPALATGMTDISTLNHKAINDSMELSVEVVEFGVVSATVLSCA